MKSMTHWFVPALLALLATGLASAQDGGSASSSWVRGGEGAKEYTGPRPPEGASPEERRSFWQKRAAERAKAEESGASIQGGSKPEEAKPAGERPSAAQIAEWRARREGNAPETPPMAGHDHGSVAAPASRPAEAARGGRPGGTGMRGGGVLWLADTPPMRGEASRGRWGGMGGMAMGGMDMGGSGPRVKRLWLRSGADPQKAPFARGEADASEEILLVTPRSKPEGEFLPAPAEGHKGLVFEMPAQGFYRLYVTTRRLQGDTLSVSVAKAEVGNFGHDGDEAERNRAMTAPRVLDGAPIEIVRERQADEGPFSQIRSGTDQAFIVLQKGLPVANARVRFVSHQGWVKEVTSDEQGRASFQVVRDYFPPWSEFQKRFKANYLVVAEVVAAESGNYREQPYTSVRYQATLAGSYYPSPNDYRSYAWGLGVGLFVILFSGAAVYLYRRRRLKPFREVRFDEKA